jgi:dolichol-phosphate mannosyltransferase
MPKVLVIIPTHQEAENIVAVIPRIFSAVPDAHILIVDDASTDGTPDLAEELDAGRGMISAIRRSTKDGLGNAYRVGFAWGLEHNYDILCEIDADLSHDPAVLPELISPVALGAQLAIGSRYIPGGAIVGWPKKRLALSRWGNRYVALMLGLAINDATAGFRAFDANIIRKCHLLDTRSDGYMFQVETTYRLVRAGARIVEIPIVFTERLLGHSKMKSSIVKEALWLVTKWGLRDMFTRRRLQVTDFRDQ